MGFADRLSMIPVPNKAALDFLDGVATRTRGATGTRPQTGR
jgi:hypothetical protein